MSLHRQLALAGLAPSPALALVVTLALISALASSPSMARPERIREGASYYSDDYVEIITDHGPVRDLGEEKNYEEVYQLYTYYEAIYDVSERVITFIEYKRGEVLRRENYRYGVDGSLESVETKQRLPAGQKNAPAAANEGSATGSRP
jgi:hypothetical protein